MKKLLTIFIALLYCCCAKAQTIYYVAENINNVFCNVAIIIKDNQSNLWFTTAGYLSDLKNNLMKDPDYYTNYFNKSKYKPKNLISKIGDSNTPLDYNTRIVEGKHVFHKLILKKKLQKCNVYDESGTEISISHDLSKLIYGSDMSNYTTLNRKTISDMNIRKSQDDLF